MFEIRSKFILIKVLEKCVNITSYIQGMFEK